MPPGPDDDQDADERPRPTRGAVREVALLFTRLGFTAFGGPAAHVALMEDEVVRRRAWLDRRHFLDLVSAINFIPGPNSTELAIHLGWLRAGFPGLVVAGVCFILPAVLIILPIAWAYARFGAVPRVQHVLLAVNAAVIAILLVAVWRLARTALTDGFTRLVAVLALVAAIAAALHRDAAALQPELLILAVAAIAGAVWYGKPLRPVLPALAILPLVGAGSQGAPLARLFLAMLKIGATLYGSGYVIVSYLRTTAVERHGWLTEQQLLDAVSVGQVTPGPLLTTATFAGYLIGHRHLGTTTGGVLGALVATAGIFLPSFVLVALLGRVITRLRTNRFARGALDAMNAAVAALILVVTLQLAVKTLAPPGAGGLLVPDLALTAVTCLATVALLRWNVNATWVVAAAAAVGAARAMYAPV
jgi:chromate transporter